MVEAVHDQSGDRVVIIHLGPELWSDEAFRERFRGDAERLASLEHPNVVRVRELVETGTETGSDGEDDVALEGAVDGDGDGESVGEPGAALVTEPVEGAPLRRLIATAAPLSPEAALTVLHDSLLGLGAAQDAGVVHRDYQPSNVVVTADGTVKVTGFGLALRTGAMMPAPGTPAYMAPELWEGAAPRPTSDLYAVTATFSECLTGRAPFSADSVFELQTLHRAAPIPVGDVPPALAPLLAQGLAKTPVERPADAADFLAEMAAIAVAEFGPEWETRGRQELAALVAALPSSPTAVLSSAPAAAAASASAAAEPDVQGVGTGTKAGIAAAVVAVLGAVVAAVAFSPGKHAAASVGPSGQFVTTPSDSATPGDDGLSPGMAAGGAPTPQSTRPASASPPKTMATSGTATSATAATTPLTTLTNVGLTAPSLNPTLPGSTFPSQSPPPSTGTTTPPSSGGPSTTPSPTATISATASLTNNKYNGPCPPANSPTGSVTFSVSGLAAGVTIPITYHWRVADGGTPGGTGGGVSGSGEVDAQNGSATQQFTILDSQHSQKGLSGTVEVSWTAPNTSGGSTSAGSVAVVCTPSGATSGGGPSTTSPV